MSKNLIGLLEHHLRDDDKFVDLLLDLTEPSLDDGEELIEIAEIEILSLTEGNLADAVSTFFLGKLAKMKRTLMKEKDIEIKINILGAMTLTNSALNVLNSPDSSEKKKRTFLNKAKKLVAGLVG
jgi:hypothetical protein